MLFLDILKNCEEIKDPAFAKKIYANLCNQVWYNIPEDEVIDFSWRSAGAFVSNIRNSIISGINENYMDYYCSGSEGEVDPQIEEWLSKFDIILFENFYLDNVSINIHDKIAELKKSNPKIITYNRNKNIDKIL